MSASANVIGHIQCPCGPHTAAVKEAKNDSLSIHCQHCGFCAFARTVKSVNGLRAAVTAAPVPAPTPTPTAKPRATAAPVIPLAKKRATAGGIWNL